MKFLKTSLVAAGFATAVLATGAAQAATINFPSTAAAPAPYGKTIVNESTRTVISQQAAGVILSFPAGEGLNVDDSITFTLTGGATWASIANTDITDTNASATTYALVEGGVGSSSAKFRVGTLDHANNVPFTVTLAATATITGTAVADNGAISIQVDMSGFVGGAQTSLFGSPLTQLAVNLAPTYTVTGTTATGIFDVATGFTTLTTSATAPSTSAASTITVTANANAAANATTAGQPAAVPTLANQLLSISGPMTGVSGITAPTLTGSSSTGVATVPALVGGMTIDAANNLAHGIANAPGPHVISLVFDGTTAYDASSYGVNVASTTDAAGYAANSSYGTVTSHTFTRNGSAFTSNSLGPLNKLTVTDRSGALGAGGADGAIGITAFDKDGNTVTCTGLTIPNVPNNGTVTIQGEDITGACPGAKRIEGIVNSTTILTSNVKNTAGGTTVQSGVNNTTAIAQ